MFTTILRSALAATIFLAATLCHAEDVHPELPIEASEVSVTHPQAGGFILVRQCKNCTMVSLQFDANSKAFFNGKAVSLAEIPEHHKSGITVIYDPKTKIVKRVFW